MLLSKMYYRISKYNPIDRIDGIYQVDDWTSYSDIGEQYGGRVVQPSEYLAVETQYISCIQDIWDACHVHHVCISGLEITSDGLSWENGQSLGRSEASQFLRDSLRERCWARLEAPRMKIEVGYELYLHVECQLSMDKIFEIANRHRLFVEPWDRFPET